MTKMTILRGVSGCGKSTWAREQNAAVVSRDDIRFIQFGSDDRDYYTADKAVLFERENLVTVIQDATIAALLKAGKDVIVDNTNIEWKYVKALAKIGYRAGAEVEVKVFDVPLHLAQQRANMRAALGGRNVDADIIRRQHERLQGTKNKALEKPYTPQPYTGTPGKPKAVLVDIDGTLAHMHDYRSPFDWKSVGKDDPDLNVMQVITWIRAGMTALTAPWAHEQTPQVILMSGRDEVCRQETFDWLVSWDFNYDHLFMRPEKDMRPDNIVKAELFDKYVRDNYDVVMVFDDRNQVVDMWRLMGLTVAQVAEGDF